MSKFIVIISVLFTQAAWSLDCDWGTIETHKRGFLYSDVCHHRVGVLVENEKDFKIEVKNLRKTIELKDLTIGELKAESSMWEKEAGEQFERFEKYKKAESKRTWLYVGGGVVGTLLIVWLAGQASN